MTSWILAFDAGCRSCTDVVDRVRACANGKLTTAGLAEPRIHELRQRALGKAAPWAPTLLAVDGDAVRAWTGPALSLHLVRLLGVADSVRVVRALNHADVVRHPGRRKLLKAVPLLGLGAFVLSGGLAAPAMAAKRSGNGSDGGAARWVRANSARLPTAYEDFVSYPMPYRRAIFAVSPPAVRTALWAKHFEDYRKAHPGLSPAQVAVIDDAAQLAPRVITTGKNRDLRALRALAATAVSLFGAQEARALLGTLGPRELPHESARTAPQLFSQVSSQMSSRAAGGTLAPSGAAWWCEATGPDCDTNCEAITGCSDATCYGPCVCSSSGCGDLWLDSCNGLCGA
ncbi:bacteriocin fulvocin C-related protein [Streptomyces sp. NPDC006476]|uniref:bacteriocin fulvocin C-related protein n=1 Tax=Streptomyces sp. NPDC006476 TaxID=3157175 RepID=UPI0033B09CED